MLTVEILNDSTGNETWGNYDYKVMVNRKVIEVGRVEKYKRACGWRGILRRVVQDRLKDNPNKL